jgi:hypothetical protein
VLYRESANTDLTRAPRLPDGRSDRGWGGLQLRSPQRGSLLRAAYLHGFPGFGGTKVAYGNGFPNERVLIGAYANNAAAVSAGITMTFL